jgi:signal transduction histidine kinase
MRVSAEQAGRPLRMTVEDEGACVPAHFRPWLSSASAVRRALRPTARGVGLGLATAGQYAVAHGGRLVYEQRPGQGTCFHVVLPAPRAHRADVAVPSGIPR